MPQIPGGVRVNNLTDLANRISGAWNAFMHPGASPSLPNSNSLSLAPQNPTTPITGVAVAQQPAQSAPPAQPTLGQRDFNPLNPLLPHYGERSPEADSPRQFQYPVGANIILRPRQDYPDLVPFDQFHNLAESYDVLAIGIGVRVEETQGMACSVAAKDKRRQRELQPTCDEALAFWAQPDGLNSLATWLGSVVHEHLVTDALTLFPRLDMGGRLKYLEQIDGSTIKPLLDDRGRTLAYQQILYGFPFSNWHRPEADQTDEQYPIYSRGELFYLPRFTRVNTPYGYPPTEKIILRANTALRKQFHDLAYFTSGNMPEGFMQLPPGTMTQTQVDEFEEWFNATLQGNDAERRKIHFLPWQAQYQEMRPFSYETALDEFMMRITCAALGVPPQEIGFTEDVNRSTAEMQEAINERRGQRPLVMWLKGAVFDNVTQNYLGKCVSRRETHKAISLPGTPTRAPIDPFKLIETQWSFGSKTDAATVAQTDQTYLQEGVVGASEIRAMRFGNELDGPAPKDIEAGKGAPAEEGGAPAGPTGEAGLAPEAAPSPEGGEAQAPGPGEAGPEATPPEGKAGAGPAKAAHADDLAKADGYDSLDVPFELRQALENAVQRRVRTVADQWSYRLARTVGGGRSALTLMDNFQRDIISAIRREIKDFREKNPEVDPDEVRGLGYYAACEMYDVALASLGMRAGLAKLAEADKFPTAMVPTDRRMEKLLVSLLKPHIAAIARTRTGYGTPASTYSQAWGDDGEVFAEVAKSESASTRYDVALRAWLDVAAQDAADMVLAPGHPQAVARDAALMYDGLAHNMPLALACDAANGVDSADIIAKRREMSGRFGEEFDSATEGKVVLVPPMHPHCRCKLKSIKKFERWLTVWTSDHFDACDQTITVPWGNVKGCYGLRGICVTSGPALGSRV